MTRPLALRETGVSAIVIAGASRVRIVSAIETADGFEIVSV